MATNPVDKFVYQQVDDPTLRQQLIDVAKTLGCTNGANNEWIAYFSNPDNIESIKDAYARYGLPAKNRESWRSKGLFGKWHDYCDWGDTYKFWYFANISRDFPSLNPEAKVNCYSIQGYLTGLAAERVNADKEFAVTADKDRHIRQLEAISDKENYYNGLYASINCDQFIAQQEAEKLAKQREEALKKSQQSNIEVYQATAGASGGGTKLALYGFGAAAVIATIILLRKKSS